MTVTGAAGAQGLTTRLGDVSPPTMAGKTPASATGTVFLVQPNGDVLRVSPNGDRKVLTRVPKLALTLSDVTDDGRYLVGWTTASEPRKIFVYDTVAKKWTVFAGPPWAEAPLFIKGTTPRLLVETSGASGHFHNVYSLTGTLLRSIPAGRAAYFNAIAGQTPGTYVVPGEDRISLLVVSADTGAVISTLRGAPTGYDCLNLRWWNKTALLASCAHDQSGYTGPTDLFVFPVSGPARAITKAKQDGLDYYRGWHSSAGTFVNFLFKNGDSGPFSRLANDKSTTPQTLGVPASKHPFPWNVINDKIYFSYRNPGSQTTTVAIYNLGTKKVTTLGSAIGLHVVDPLE